MHHGNEFFLPKVIVGTAMIIACSQSVQYSHALVHKGMVQFCASNFSQCRPDTVGEVTISIRPVAQAPGRDRWNLNLESGVCEDFALSNLARLMRWGVAPNALRIAISHICRGEPHAVLVVKTSHGDYVLDNLSQRIAARATACGLIPRRTSCPGGASASIERCDILRRARS